MKMNWAQQVQFFEKLVADKDRIANDRLKVGSDPSYLYFWLFSF